MDKNLKRVIRECVLEMRAYTPQWDDDDIFLAACGAALKYAEESGYEITLELQAAIRVCVRLEMRA